MKAYEKAYELKEQEKDRQNWSMGQYIYSAVSVVLDHAFNKNATSKYPEQPFLQDEQFKEVDIETQREINAQNVFRFLENSQKAFEETHKNQG